MAYNYDEARKKTIADVVDKYKDMLTWDDISQNEYDDERFEERAMQFFDFCAEKGIRPTKEGIAAACGITIAQFRGWESGAVQVSDRRHRVVEKINSILLAMLTEWGLNNTTNTGMNIFLMKNDYGFSDEPEKAHRPTDDPLGKPRSNEEIAEKLYADVIEGGGDNAKEKKISGKVGKSVDKKSESA